MKKNKNSTYNKYLSVFYIFFVLSLLAVALFNFKIDPENIYKKFSKNQKEEESFSISYVKKLISSKTGLFYRNDLINERDIKYSLSAHPTEAECAILGSSPVLQISSFRNIKSLSSICSSLINLGTTAAVLEDYLIFSEKLFLNKQAPSKIIISVHPYTFNLNRDAQWLRYKSDYEKIKDEIMFDKKDFKVNKIKKNYYTVLLENLINMKYFLKSYEIFSLKEKLKIEEVKILDYKYGMKHHVLLPDGSLIYSRKNIDRKMKREIDGYSGIQNYKIKIKNIYNPYAIKMFNRLIEHLSKKFEVIIILIPYHPSVWNFPEQPAVKAMKIVEPIVIDIAKQNNISLYGSYNPKNILCKSNEYYDEIHTMSSCLEKIEKFQRVKKN